MITPTLRLTGADPTAFRGDRALCERVYGEFSEMPGLRLTLAQAARLFNLEVTRCSQVLNALVAQGALWTNGHEFLAINVGRPSV